MDQELALEILASGEHVLLTGAAGSGKTYVLNEFIRRSKKAGKHVSVTATTGLAATHLQGTTIHAWSGIGIHDRLPNRFIEYFTKGRRDIIQKTDILIIDEISMLHDYRLDMVDEVARMVRGNHEPFGGIQVVLCGDFFQLPPVNRNDGRDGGFVVNADVWKRLEPVICYLNEQHRQDDTEFLEILNAMRGNDLRRRHAERLLARVPTDDLPSSSGATELHTTNVDVDTINNRRLEELETEPHTYEMSTTGKVNYVDSLKRSCLALETLVLKEGALVMCIRNNPEKKYVNGSLGVVVGFEEIGGFPIVELRNGKTVTLTPETWELRDGDKKRASLSQIPLRLAWAITVHKSQGMTLDAARVDLRRAFVEGMGYVALSRVRNLENLELVGINTMALRVSPEALRIEEDLRRLAAEAAVKFEPLRENARKRPKESKKDKDSAGTWTAKLEKMRETYPNAYRPWKPTDDAKLLSLYDRGNGIDELTNAFGRHPGSISKRLEKLLGREIQFS